MRRLWRAMRLRFENMQLRKKLLASYLLVLVISMAILVIYAVRTSRESSLRTAQMAVAGMVNNTGSGFELKMEQLDNLIAICAFQKELQAVYRNQFDSYYELYEGLNKTVNSFYQIVMDYCWGDIQQLTIYSTTGLKKYGRYVDNVQAVSAEPWFHEAMERSGLWWMIQGDRVIGLCRVDSVQPNIAPGTMGLLYALLDADFLSNYLEINCPTYEFVIYGGEGEEIYRHVFGDPTLIAESGNVLLHSYAWEAQGWKMEYRVPIEALAGSGREWIRVNLLIVLAGIAVLLAIIFWLTHTLFGRISQLQVQIQAVRQGDLNLNISSGSRDEIGMLANAFGEMLVSLREQMEKTREAERYSSNLELRALRAQIDPHFLYNTLSYINWLALRSNNDDIGYAVEQLSAFYRTCLNEGKELIGVRQEMDNIKAYISVQLLLHSDSFEVEYEEDERLYECQMLSFLLQPIVENAIVHGVDQRPEGGGCIRIATRLDGNTMRFCIQDNGPGFALGEDGQLAPIVEKGHGYGVANIEQRIRCFYGDGWGIRYSNLPDGCIATVELPASL